jgi:hypothetical protein
MRAVVLALLATACAVRPVSGLTRVARDTPQQCQRICRDIGLGAGAVVILANEVACVCANAASNPNAAALAAAMGAQVAARRADDRREEAWAGGF